MKKIKSAKFYNPIEPYRTLSNLSSPIHHAYRSHIELISNPSIPSSNDISNINEHFIDPTSISYRTHRTLEPGLYYTNNTISSNHYRTYRTTLISLSNLLSNLYRAHRAHNAKNQKTHHINEMNLGTTQKCQKNSQNRISFGKKNYLAISVFAISA